MNEPLVVVPLTDQRAGSRGNASNPLHNFKPRMHYEALIKMYEQGIVGLARGNLCCLTTQATPVYCNQDAYPVRFRSSSCLADTSRKRFSSAKALIFIDLI